MVGGRRRGKREGVEEKSVSVVGSRILARECTTSREAALYPKKTLLVCAWLSEIKEFQLGLQLLHYPLSRWLDICMYSQPNYLVWGEFEKNSEIDEENNVSICTNQIDCLCIKDFLNLHLNQSSYGESELSDGYKNNVSSSMEVVNGRWMEQCPDGVLVSRRCTNPTVCSY